MEVGYDRQGGATTQLEGSPARWTGWETVGMSKKQTAIQVSLGWQKEALTRREYAWLAVLQIPTELCETRLESKDLTCKWVGKN